jgi:hypothetical protein
MKEVEPGTEVKQNYDLDTEFSHGREKVLFRVDVSWETCSVCVFIDSNARATPPAWYY